MAEKTQGKAPPARAVIHAVPASDLREGAAGSAPTAPHATPRAPAGTTSAGHARRVRATGPERFWNDRRVRVALAVSVVASVLVHYVIGPWTLMPDVDVEFHDVDGDLAIPVDLLQGEPPPPPPPIAEPAPPPAPKSTDPNAPGAADAGPVAKHDAGPRPDAAPPRDAASDGPTDAKTPEGGPGDAQPTEAGPLEAGREGGVTGEGGSGDAGAVASAEGPSDAGPGRGGPHDAVGMIGAAGGVQAGTQNVVLVVNMDVIRQHPVGGKLGPLVAAIPQWDDFLGGTHVDPVRDIDWILINGPSLYNTERDAILVHYSAADAVVDHAIQLISKRYDHGGPFDAGVPGVKAALGKADRFERVFLRPQPHLAAIVPRDYAPTAARLLRRAQLKSPRAGEALRVTLHKPHDSVGIRAAGIEIPESIADLRVWIVPRADGGADVFGEGDTPDAAAALAAAADMRKIVRSLRRNIVIAIASQGLLDGLDFSADGPTMRLHLGASRDQIEGIALLVAGRFGVDLQFPPLVDP